MTELPTRSCNVILFTAPHCAFCPAVSEIFSTLHKQGKLSHFEKYDLTSDLSLAKEYNIRSVPWFKINELEFFGTHNTTEIEYWIEHSQSNTGILRYITESLEAGRLRQIESLIRKHPSWLTIALDIVAETNSPIQARIGLGAVLEGLAGDKLLTSILPRLEIFINNQDHRIRADACHYLSLIPTSKSIELLKLCRTDSHPEVRELAEDGLECIKPG